MNRAPPSTPLQPRRHGPNILELGDKRRLAWYDHGDPNGKPCIFTPGAPASGIAGSLFHAAAAAREVRWISVDKPGYGDSTAKSDWDYTHWAADIAALAQHLKLERFAVAGESGGTPPTFAVAQQLPKKVTAVLVVAGLGPWDDDRMRREMRPEHYAFYEQARNDPQSLIRKIEQLKTIVDNPLLSRAWLEKALEAAPAADRDLLNHIPYLADVVIAAYRGALRQGAETFIRELQLLQQPWSFSPQSIAAPVFFWHGTEDRNVPIAVARDFARSFANGQLTELSGAGHGLYLHAEAMVSTVPGGST